MENCVLQLFGLHQFKPFQKKAINELLNHNDVFLSEPTGSGKSVIFQALPFFYGQEKQSSGNHIHGTENTSFVFTNKLLVVISPLVSLMKDQQKSLQNKGIQSICLIDPSITEKEVFFIKSNI